MRAPCFTDKVFHYSHCRYISPVLPVVPQPDLSDLPSLVAFFEKHDTIAQRIAEAGQAWAQEQLGQERARASLKAVLEGFASLGL